MVAECPFPYYNLRAFSKVNISHNAIEQRREVVICIGTSIHSSSILKLYKTPLAGENPPINLES